METPKVETIDIKDMTIIELKALIVDESDKIQLSNHNIQILRAEIQKRQ